MRSFSALIKKECLEQLRSGKILILIIICIILGVMNPAIAKLTPWLMEAFSDSLAETGITVTEVEINAVTSWVQFFKNIPMGVIVFVLMQSSIFTKEYQSGTMILTLTKGVKRWKIAVAKALVLLALWSLFFWLAFFITYIYNSVFWDNGIAGAYLFGALAWWLLGVLACMLAVLFSGMSDSNIGVLAGVGGVFLFGYVIGFIPAVKDFSFSKLMKTSALLVPNAALGGYISALLVTIALLFAAFFTGICIFGKKQL